MYSMDAVFLCLRAWRLLNGLSVVGCISFVRKGFVVLASPCIDASIHPSILYLQSVIDP